MQSISSGFSGRPLFERNATTLCLVSFLFYVQRPFSFVLIFPNVFCNVAAYFKCALKENEYAMQP